jgi:peptidoglycan/xylan/chitin deacetylase (PgdA/CDA1 family)
MIVLGFDVKNLMASFFGALRLDELGFWGQRTFYGPFIRAINYHDVPPFHAKEFERQLLYYKNRFEIVGPTELESLATARKVSSRPGLILSFDDGLRSHADVVAPLLEKHGLTGWFMVPGGFVDEAPEKQRDFARDTTIEYYDYDYGDPRIAMSWSDIRSMARTHEFGCHTWSHKRLTTSLSDEELGVEIHKAKKQMEERLGLKVRTFCWVGGEEFAYSKNASRVIREAGFQFSFMSNSQIINADTDMLQLQRTNIEARNGEKIVRFQLSGAMDLFYLPKRRRINILTKQYS